MTLKEFAQMLDGSEYLNEITKEEKALAKELGFVVVFGYSDDNAELRGAIDDEIDCFNGGVLEHDDLPSAVYADWCPEDIDCSWAYRTSIPHENFNIYENGELYCVGIVCDINKPKPTNADRIRAMSDEELADMIFKYGIDDHINFCEEREECQKLIELDRLNPWGKECRKCMLEWLKQPGEVGG